MGDSIRKSKKDTTIFDLWDSLFVDECTVLFKSRTDMIAVWDCLCKHFLRFGLYIHIGPEGVISKTGQCTTQHAV
jgi:hypothetical protein